MIAALGSPCVSLTVASAFKFGKFVPSSFAHSFSIRPVSAYRSAIHHPCLLKPFPVSTSKSPSLVPLVSNKRHFRLPARGSSGDMESVEKNPGLVEQVDEETKSYIMQQTMYRIKDPKASLEFYSKVLGMRLLKRFDYPEAKFSLYFLGYEDPSEIPSNSDDRLQWTFTRRGTVELTHNWGTESDPEFKGYHNGNTDPRGWGHIGITVDDVYKACERFEKLNVQFVKKPDEGRMKGLAFIKDPDGYWIEILDVKHMLALNA